MRKIVRDFRYTESDNNGSCGLVPVWIPDNAYFDAGWGQSVAHDMLEHRLCDKGDFANEVMAFGAILYVRGDQLATRNKYRKRTHEQAIEELGDELCGIWSMAEFPALSFEQVAWPNREEMLELSGINILMRGFEKQARREVCSRLEEDPAFEAGQFFYRHLEDLLLTGYIEAKRRLSHLSKEQTAIYYAFQEIEEAASEEKVNWLSPIEGDKIRITLAVEFDTPVVDVRIVGRRYY